MSGVTDAPKPGLLLDADVLIDYAHADDGILRLVARHLAPVRVLSTTRNEVREFRNEDYSRLGITILIPTADQEEAAAGISSRSSLNDLLCLVVCRGNDWTLATNDRILRKVCEEYGVRTRYGLELMLDLFAIGCLPRSRAESVAERLHSRSPEHFHRGLIDWFRVQLGRIASRSHPPD